MIGANLWLSKKLARPSFGQCCQTSEYFSTYGEAFQFNQKMTTGIIGRKSNAYANLTRLRLFDVYTNLQYSNENCLQHLRIVELNVSCNVISSDVLAL